MARCNACGIRARGEMRSDPEAPLKPRHWWCYDHEGTWLLACSMVCVQNLNTKRIRKNVWSSYAFWPTSQNSEQWKTTLPAGHGQRYHGSRVRR